MSEQELKAALEAAVPGLEVVETYRPRPVAVRGKVDGYGFTFRAWDRFTVHFAVDGHLDGAAHGALGWSHDDDYSDPVHDAGDMSDADVIACIVKAVGLWRGRP